MNAPVPKNRILLNCLCLAGALLLACFVPPAISTSLSPYQALPALLDMRGDHFRRQDIFNCDMIHAMIDDSMRAAGIHLGISGT